MNRVDTIKDVWRSLEKEGTDGLVKRAIDIPSCLKTFCTYKLPDGFIGIAFSFHQDIKIDISNFHDLSELNVSLFNDSSFPNSKLLLIQLTNREHRAIDIFAIICANIVGSILEVDSEREGIKLVIAQMRKWKDLFSRRKNQKLSLQEQQGLYGELFFLRKLIRSIDKSTAISVWGGPELAPKDFQSDMWAVEVKTTSVTPHSGISINGELQLDESNIEQLFLYNLVVEVLQQDGQTLPEIIVAIRELLAGENRAIELFESKLLLSGYSDLDEQSYKDRHYHVRKEQYFRVKDDFPRIKKQELRMGVSEVKYNISLNFSSENMIVEENVINTIVSYEGNR